MKSSLMVCASLLTLIGCQATSDLAKETEGARDRFAKSAEKEVKQTADKASKELNKAVESGKEAVATVNQSKEILQRILESHNLTDADRKWIVREIREGGPDAQKALQPVVVAVYKHVPAAREWAKQTAKDAFNESKDDIWKVAMDLIESYRADAQ